jgi:hypothetical protein
MSDLSVGRPPAGMKKVRLRRTFELFVGEQLFAVNHTLLSDHIVKDIDRFSQPEI